MKKSTTFPIPSGRTPELPLLVEDLRLFMALGMSSIVPYNIFPYACSYNFNVLKPSLIFVSRLSAKKKMKVENLILSACTI